MAIVKMKTAIGEEVTVKLVEGAGSGKGRTFTPEVTQSFEQVEQERGRNGAGSIASIR